MTPDARQLCEPSAGDLLASVVICVASAGKMIFAHSGQFVYRPTVGSLLASVAISGLTAAYKSVGAILDRPLSRELSREPGSMPESCTCDRANISRSLKVGCIQNVHLY